jgi:DNA adenine methylase
MAVEKVLPPLKWAGGKRWFVAQHADAFPKRFSTYIEPFLGSGAVFFHLKPSAAVLADVNAELINVYEAIRDRPALVRSYLGRHHRLHGARYYYRIRGATPRSNFVRAARTLYLNRTCWNGLYRVNLGGEFNVPLGTKSSVVLPTDDFRAVSDALHSRVKLAISDFEPIMDRAKRGDFVFVDPPYTVAHNYNGFIKYNEKLFSWPDQLRLRCAIDRAVSRGAKVLLTNANHQSVAELYRDFDCKVLARFGRIAANTVHRGTFEELLIRCW